MSDTRQTYRRIILLLLAEEIFRSLTRYLFGCSLCDKSYMARAMFANRDYDPYTELFTQYIETAYAAMYERHRIGPPPHNIFVQA